MYKLIPINPVQTYEEPLYQTKHCKQLIASMKPFYEKVGYQSPWVGYFITDDEVVYGTTSFASPPNNGEVEIAYWTFSEYEGRGIASHACKAIIDIAKSFDSKIRITAKTEPRANASTRILEKNGFEFVKIVQDHEIGDAWLWQKN